MAASMVMLNICTGKAGVKFVYCFSPRYEIILRSRKAMRRPGTMAIVLGGLLLVALASRAEEKSEMQERASAGDAGQQAQSAGDAGQQEAGALGGLPVMRETLENGLRVVMSPDRTVPTVAIALYYDVGSRDEVKGRSGFAHLFEHMMFQGSRNVGKMEHFQLIMRRGGDANGTTSHDAPTTSRRCPATSSGWGSGWKPTACARWP
jgi:hypothetical protein